VNPPTILALHGFTGGGSDFAPLVEALPEFNWLTPDLPGHAPDPNAPGAPGDACRLATSLRYLDSIVPEKPDGPLVLLGYSLGGRLALHFALERPERIAALVLIGTSPGIADNIERVARQAEDDKLAQNIIAQGVPAFLQDWQQRPLIASQSRLPETWRAAMRERRRRLRAEGLAASLRQFGQGMVEPVWERLGELRRPILVCAGVNDEKYAAQAKEIQRRCPRAKLLLVPQAGHMAHLENCEAFAANLRDFLGKCTSRGKKTK